MQDRADHDEDAARDHYGFRQGPGATDDVSASGASFGRRADNHPYRDAGQGLLARRRRLTKELERLRARTQHVRAHLDIVDALVATQELDGPAPRRRRTRDALLLALRSAHVMCTGALLGLVIALVASRPASEGAQEAISERLEGQLRAAATEVAEPEVAEPAVAEPAVAEPAAEEPIASAPQAASPPERRAPWPLRDLESIFDNHVARLDADTFEIERGYVQELLHTSASTLHRVRVTPRSERGRVIGVRVHGIRAAGIAGRLGLREGDTLLAINGMEMGRAESSIAAYTRLREAEVLALLIERRGRRRILVYHLVDELSHVGEPASTGT